MSRTKRLVATLISAMVACLVSGRLAGQVSATQFPQANTQITSTPQYRLMIMAAYYPGQGLRTVSVEANGPADA